jgi:hypothetical protein
MTAAWPEMPNRMPSGRRRAELEEQLHAADLTKNSVLQRSSVHQSLQSENTGSCSDGECQSFCASPYLFATCRFAHTEMHGARQLRSCQRAAAVKLERAHLYVDGSPDPAQW